MSRSAFDAEVALDLAVNFIPPIILVFFTVLFAVFNPWGFAPLQSTIQFALILSMIVAVGTVTYVGARLIEGDGAHRHEGPSSVSDERDGEGSVDDEDDAGQRHHDGDGD